MPSVEKQRKRWRDEYWSNVEARKASRRRYYRSHKDKESERFKEWRERNKSHRKHYMDAYNERRKHRQKEYDRLRYLRPENISKRELLKPIKKQYNRSYHQRNRERWLSRCYRDRALKRQNRVGNLQAIIKWMRSWRTPRLVRCYWCGKKSRGNACHGDHIIALSDGGAHSLENLCISCSTCNMKKHDKPLSIWNQQIVEPVLL